ncbi:hypothetical protein NEAUS03_1515 [Nematocida ausubeli]|nr:hypothetical protein NEAUS03_1515 [Nematocida ausubeli]
MHAAVTGCSSKITEILYESIDQVLHTSLLHENSNWLRFISTSGITREYIKVQKKYDAILRLFAYQQEIESSINHSFISRLPLLPGKTNSLQNTVDFFTSKPENHKNQSKPDQTPIEEVTELLLTDNISRYLNDYISTLTEYSEIMQGHLWVLKRFAIHKGIILEVINNFVEILKINELGIIFPNFSNKPGKTRYSPNELHEKVKEIGIFKTFLHRERTFCFFDKWFTKDALIAEYFKTLLNEIITEIAHIYYYTLPSDFDILKYVENEILTEEWSYRPDKYVKYICKFELFPYIFRLKDPKDYNIRTRTVPYAYTLKDLNSNQVLTRIYRNSFVYDFGKFMDRYRP